MTDLIACLSTGKGTGAHVLKVMQGMPWDKVYLIVNHEFKESFKNKEKAEVIYIDTNKSISNIAEHIKSNLQGKIKDLEVGVNLVSGEGKEHMAVLHALLELGLGIRLVALTKEGVKSLS